MEGRIIDMPPSRLAGGKGRLIFTDQSKVTATAWLAVLRSHELAHPFVGDPPSSIEQIA
jgi:hypothetical protein